MRPGKGCTRKGAHGEDKLQARDHVEDEDILSDDAPIPDEEIGPDEEPHMKGKVLNAVLCVLAFGILCAYLFLAGEANDLVYAVENIRWTWLALALVMVVLYWVLESACVQVFSNKIFPGFSFWKMNIVTVIGQYFNCVTRSRAAGSRSRRTITTVSGCRIPNRRRCCCAGSSHTSWSPPRIAPWCWYCASRISARIIRL